MPNKLLIIKCFRPHGHFENPTYRDETTTTDGRITITTLPYPRPVPETRPGLLVSVPGKYNFVKNLASMNSVVVIIV